MSADVPAYITQPAFVQNGVKVQAGTNWDFSRGAVATPIVPTPDPTPHYPAEVSRVDENTSYQAIDKMPGQSPELVVLFSRDHATLSSVVRGQLSHLNKRARYVIAGHSDSSEKSPELLSRQRANAVGAQLKRQGFKITQIRSFGERRSLTADTAPLNSRVEIIQVD